MEVTVPPANTLAPVVKFVPVSTTGTVEPVKPLFGRIEVRVGSVVLSRGWSGAAKTISIIATTSMRRTGANLLLSSHGFEG